MNGAVWSESTLLAIPFASFGWRSSLIRVSLFVIPFASFGWRSSLIRVYTVCHSMKEQSDQNLHCLPLHLHRLDEGAFRLHRLDKGAVWSGSTLFAIPFEGAVWSGSILFAIPFASFGRRSNLIKVYTVCHSVCIVWMKEKSDQGLPCLPFHSHCFDEGAVWSGSTLFAIPFASFGWRSSLIRVYTVIPFASFGWRSSLIWVYTVCHSICIIWINEQSDQGYTVCHSVCIVWMNGANLIRVYTVCHSICIIWMKEQSDQGLHCHSICIIWMKEQSDQGLHCLPFHQGAVWSESTLFATSFAWRSIPFASFG